MKLFFLRERFIMSGNKKDVYYTGSNIVRKFKRERKPEVFFLCENYNVFTEV